MANSLTTTCLAREALLLIGNIVRKKVIVQPRDGWEKYRGLQTRVQIQYAPFLNVHLLRLSYLDDLGEQSTEEYISLEDLGLSLDAFSEKYLRKMVRRLTSVQRAQQWRFKMRRMLARANARIWRMKTKKK